MSEENNAKEIAVYEPHQIEVSTLPDPELAVDFAIKAAQALIKVVKASKQKPIIKVKNQEYVKVEGWQFIASAHKATPKIEWTRPLPNSEGFEARAVVIDNRSGLEIGAGEAECRWDESNWMGKPEFQLRSMAQTRAVGKALRNLFSWVVMLAGYQPTPAEEMTGNENVNKSQLPGKNKKLEALIIWFDQLEQQARKNGTQEQFLAEVEKVLGHREYTKLDNVLEAEKLKKALQKK